MKFLLLTTALIPSVARAQLLLPDDQQQQQQQQQLEWIPKSSFTASSNLGRHHPIVFANETHAFLLGGTTADNAAVDDFYIYEPTTDVWTDLTDTPSQFPGTPRSFGYGIVLNQANHPKAYLGFGASATSERLNDFWEFDMETHLWKQLSSLPPGLGRRHPSMVPVFNDDATDEWTIHVGLGDGYVGNDQFSNFNDYWSYSIQEDTWTQLPDFPSSKRHHPFFFGIGGRSYVGLGHSDGQQPYIERDFYSYTSLESNTLQQNGWRQEPDFASYLVEASEGASRGGEGGSQQQIRTLQTTEARVAGTEFSIDLPLVGDNNSNNTTDELRGSLGFVLSGDGDDHRAMSKGEFHAFYPPQEGNTTNTGVSEEAWWRQLTPHPGASRWAPASFVMRGTANAYMTCGYDRSTNTLHSDMWMMDLSPLFRSTSVMAITGSSAAAGSGTFITSGSEDITDITSDASSFVRLDWIKMVAAATIGMGLL